MTDVAVKNLKALAKARADIASKCYPAFDELLLYSLERRHLDVPEYSCKEHENRLFHNSLHLKI